MAITVSVFKKQNQTNYICQWTDPVSGKKKCKSSGTSIKRDAERFAGQLEKELNDGTYHENVRMTWEAFRQRFEENYLPGLSVKTQ